jgi:hypothetical protein
LIDADLDGGTIPDIVMDKNDDDDDDNIQLVAQMQPVQSKVKGKGKVKSRAASEKEEDNDDEAEDLEVVDEYQAPMMSVNKLDSLCAHALFSYAHINILDLPAPIEFGRWNA